MTQPAAQPPDPPQDTPRHIFLQSGTLYCGSEPTVASTVLGSCVAVCLIDRLNRGCGINHFVLPHSPNGELSLRYGDVAIERLADKMLRLGCDLSDLRAKLFGGAAVLPFAPGEDSVGTKNVKIAQEWLREHRIPIIAQRTGGKNGLLIRLFTATGRVLVRKVVSTKTSDLCGLVSVQDWRQSDT
jgi:chemotaxis protein CheD